MRTRELATKGMSERDAREEALRLFGDIEETRTSCTRSDQRREQRMERREVVREVWADAWIALRQLGRRPGFAAAAVATLAVGIGATTTIFSAADHVLFRPLPYNDVDRVMTIWEIDRSEGGAREEFSPANFLDLAARTRAFAAVGLAEPYGFDLTEVIPPIPVEAWLVTDGWLNSLGVKPVAGRGFLPEEFGPDGPFVVMLDHDLWRTRYAADPSVIGTAIELGGASATIVGVLPPGLEYPVPEGILSPKKWRVSDGYDERTERTSGYMLVVGRLRGGMSADDARSDLDRVARELAAEFPESNRDRGLGAVQIRDHVLGSVRPALLILLAAVLFVLLIACANVASLIMTRTAERARELSVRAALGAARARLTRQLLTESLVLASIGGLSGVSLALGGVRVVKNAAPPAIPRIDALALDGRILAFALLLTLTTTILFGLAPALRFSRPTFPTAARSGERSAALAARSRFLRTLVVGEIALALMLLVGAGLLGRSFLRVTSNEPGFESEGKATLQLFMYDGYASAAAREAAVDELSRRLVALPGVRGVAVASALPFQPEQVDPQDQLIIEGRADPSGGRLPTAYTFAASAGFFRLMGTPVVAGREFTEDDRFETPRVALINETLARRYFPGEDPVGKRVTIGVMSAPQLREIVGVVADMRATALESDPRPEIYVPYRQSRTGSVSFVVEADGDPRFLLPAMRDEVARMNSAQAIYHLAAIDDMISDTLVPRRFYLLLLGGLSAVALVLAAVGIYGLISYITTGRTGEIGLRVALGARRADVVRMVVVQGLRLAIPGVALGLLASLTLTRFLDRLLYGVEATDPLTLGPLALGMIVVCVAATYLPARRASGTDPAEALRAE